MPFAESTIRSKHSDFADSTNRSANAFKLDSTPENQGRYGHCPAAGAERPGVKRISIEDDCADAVQEPVAGGGEVPSDLRHPGLVRLTGDPGNRHAAGLQLHDEETT